MVAFKSFNATPNLLHPPDTVGTEARRTLQVRRCQLGGPAAYAHDVTAGIHECYPASGTSLRRRRYMETEEERVASARQGGPLLPARLSISGMAFTSHGFFYRKMLDLPVAWRPHNSFCFRANSTRCGGSFSYHS